MNPFYSRRRLGTALAASAAMLTGTLARAADAAASNPLFAAPGAEGGGGGGSTLGALRVTLSLALVLALLFAVAWAARRFRLVPGGPARRIQVIAQASLGARERVVWVNAAGRELLLGVGPGNVRTLLDLGSTGTLDPVSAPDASHEPPPAPGFAELLRRSLGR